MTPEADLRARVERGATFLDHAEPRWWKRVEQQLQMSSCKHCALGQVYGDYSKALTVLVGMDYGERDSFATAHGFERSSATWAEYDVLDRLWLEAIEARRADPERYVP